MHVSDRERIFFVRGERKKKILLFHIGSYDGILVYTQEREAIQLIPEIRHFQNLLSAGFVKKIF